MIAREVRGARLSSRIVGRSPAIRRVIEQADQAAATNATILLIGETGTGKELVASAIHERGSRQDRPMVRVSCAATPATLIESELFGRERGAFTGSLARQIGRIERAQGSAVFLDEIGDFPAEVQAKLLRVLEHHRLERLGSSYSMVVDVRVIAATRFNLGARVAAGTFRRDLFDRLNVFPIDVPALRDRQEDIPLLAWHFVDEFSKSFGTRIDSIDRDTMAALQRYSWPGNVRELRNLVEGAMINANGKCLTIGLPPPYATAPYQTPRLIDVEKNHIQGVLEHTGWRIRGDAGAAKLLGVKPTTLETRLAKLGLKRPGRA